MISLTHTDIVKLVPTDNPLGTTLGTSSIKRPFLQYSAKNVKKYLKLRESVGMLFCDICGYRPKFRADMPIEFQSRIHPDRRLVVDHCHYTQIIRGLLCQQCNSGLGNFKDVAGRLIGAAKYIISFKIWYPIKAHNERFWGLVPPAFIKKVSSIL